jgi:hypothetical protein
MAINFGDYIIDGHKLEGDSAIFTMIPKPPEVIDSKHSDECIEKGICTFKNTGKKYSIQSWYQCKTCDTYCCIVCKEQCHNGHQLSEESKSEFFCDCGAGNVNCKALPTKTN